MCKASSSPPQIFVLLQYQTLAHRIKATVLRAANLDMLDGTSALAGNTRVQYHLKCWRLINELPEASSTEALRNHN